MKKYKAKGSTLRFFAPYGRLRDFMSEKMTKFKSTFLSVQEGVRKFSYTDWYILLVLAIGVTGWALKNAVVGFVGMVLVSSVVLVLSDDILPLTVNAFGAMLMIYTDKLDEFLKMWPSLIVLVVAIVIFVVRNAVAKVKRKDRFVFGKMFFPQIAISIALLLGGIGTIAVDRYVASLPNVLALGIGVLAIYLLFANFIKRNDEIDYAKYFAKVLMWIGFAVSIQLCVVIAKSGIAPNEWAKGQPQQYRNVLSAHRAYGSLPLDEDEKGLGVYPYGVLAVRLPHYDFVKGRHTFRAYSTRVWRGVFDI